MSKTKEEIMKSKVGITLDYRHEKKVTPSLFAYIDRCMTEYAQQTAIEFAEWMVLYAYIKDDYWYLHEKMSGETYTTDELYSLYLKSKPHAK